MSATYRGVSASTQQAPDFRAGARAERSRILAMAGADPDSKLSPECARAIAAGTSALDFAEQLRGGTSANRGKAFADKHGFPNAAGLGNSGNRGADFVARHGRADSAAD